MEDSYYIQSLAAVHGGEGITLTILSADGEKQLLTVSAEDYTAYKLQKGEIDGELLLALTEAADLYDARRAAFRILSAGQCSQKKLFEKLCRRGFSAKQARAASDFAASSGYMDERWQIESYLREMVDRKCMGRRKILPALLAKGYRAEDIYAVMDEKYSDRDFAAAKKTFLEKKFGKTVPESREEAKAMREALYKQGF